MNPEDYAKGTTEHSQQVALFMWAAIEASRHRELQLLFAVPNGGDRRASVGANLKAEGVKKGVLDVCLPVARRGFHGLWIEMKRPASKGKAKGELTPEQRDFWLPRLVNEGYATQVCWTFAEARDTLRWYLGI